MSDSNRKYRIGGYQPGSKPNDAKSHTGNRFTSETLPPKVDLRQFMTAVESQVGNSCVANAFVGAYEYLAKRSLGDSVDVSRLFVYYNARVEDNSQNEDSGTRMASAIKALSDHGSCAEDLWPNDENRIGEEPDQTAYEQAANFKISDAEFIETNLDLWRHTLAEGHPIAFALNTFGSFDDATRNRGRVPMPKASDNVRETHGWHAMLCVGYSDKDRMFIVRNSWGPEWGDQGYCYVPYGYVIHQDFNGHDSWIIKSLTDLDFSKEVWGESDSFFADENSLLLYDFSVYTHNPDEFVEALDQLCQNYTESEEGYYFDYEFTEDEDGTTVDIRNFDLTIETAEDFLDELDSLCAEYAIDDTYGFSTGSVDSQSDGEEEEIESEDEEEDDEYEEEEIESEEEDDDEYEEEDDDEYEEEDEVDEYEEEDE